MAQVFTTSFEYKGATYTAHITQVDGTFTISVPHTELHTLIPNGQAVYNIDKGLELSTPQLTQSQDLMVAILASIEANGGISGNTSSSPAGKEAK